MTLELPAKKREARGARRSRRSSTVGDVVNKGMIELPPLESLPMTIEYLNNALRKKYDGDLDQMQEDYMKMRNGSENPVYLLLDIGFSVLRTASQSTYSNQPALKKRTG